ncbi:hypothetical protein BIW11_01629 [Tropilaelaps mercedesae]|uniref:Uncharacterized protein n=1 Tax=Tropilaelaps mercedesae TaxID=418985 RepID=A0A1V9XB49_9ACAR|nr:hypothetical protein BIW11_01629 [Tropilaelaps mercedesae]
MSAVFACRVSVLDSASPAPEEELPSLQSSTSSSSSDSPVPAKKDKECEARPPKDAPKPRKASLPSATVSSKGTTSSFALPPSRAFDPSPVDYPTTSLSPQVSSMLRSSVASSYPTRLPSIRPLTRSTSVSPVRTALPGKTPLAPSKSLSSALAPHQTASFKYTSSHQPPGAMSTNGRRAVPTSTSHTPSALPRRTPSSSLKRPQPAPVPKPPKTTSSSQVNDNPAHSHTTATHSASAVAKVSATPRPSLLSPTVSSALKSCAVPLRTVNSMTRADCEVHGNAHHRRSLALTSAGHVHAVAQENKNATTPVSKRSSVGERSLRKPSKSTPSSATLTTAGAAVIRRSGAILDRPKTTGTRKSLDLAGLRRKTFADDMFVC